MTQILWLICIEAIAVSTANARWFVLKAYHYFSIFRLASGMPLPEARLLRQGKNQITLCVQAVAQQTLLRSVSA